MQNMTLNKYQELSALLPIPTHVLIRRMKNKTKNPPKNKKAGPHVVQGMIKMCPFIDVSKNRQVLQNAKCL